MSTTWLVLPILIPLLAALVILCIGKREIVIKPAVAFAACLADLIVAIVLSGSNLGFSRDWAGFGIQFSLRVDPLSDYILIAASLFAFVVSIYTLAAFRKKEHGKLFFLHFMLTMSAVNGTILANNLVVMLFFWSIIMWPAIFMVLAGGHDKYPTVIKGLTLNAIADLCIMLGIAITGHLSNTLMMDGISRIPIAGLGVLGFAFLIIGAIGEAGSVPFHTWIVDAAVDAPVSFVALVPATLQKLLGGYFLVRACVDFYDVQPGSGAGLFLMIVGAITILGALFLALCQENYKKIMAYHCVSQSGYVIMAVGTALPMGMVGALFHISIITACQCCLFMTAGAIEDVTGTMNIRQLGGLWRKMPITTWCAVLCAASLVGVPPLGGFFSQEMIFNASLQAGSLFYIAALLGTFLSAVSFFRVGHGVFFGKGQNYNLTEANGVSCISMIVLAALAVLYGVLNKPFLEKIIQPIFVDTVFAGESFAGLPQNLLLSLITILLIVLAFSNHMYGCFKTGSPLGATFQFRQHKWVDRMLYATMEKRYFDPYEMVLRFISWFAYIAKSIVKGIEWLYDKFCGRLTEVSFQLLGRLDGKTGLSCSKLILWEGILTLILVVCVVAFRA